jgi:TolB-like protein/Tfp pilus assembly protein PilF
VPRKAVLMSLAESIADGTRVDWEAAETHATVDERPVIRQLRVLSELAGLHRTLPVDSSEQSPVLARGPKPEARGPLARHSAKREGGKPEVAVIGSWGHLALLERLGGGSFGEVYRAWDRQLEREVALKLLRGEASADDPRTSRIAIEGRLLARVRHPNVISVHGVAVHDGRVGLWMELVRGATLEQLLQQRGPFSAREAALIGIDLCRALAAIHAAGLIHRDVKTQNVLREDGGRVVLMDLGTGRESSGSRDASADMAGTPLYLAPEIFDGGSASVRTDIYSLGVLLYRLVTVSFPVRATSMEDLRAAHGSAGAVGLRDARADLPTAFVRVVDRAIGSDPEKRYATTGALEADLVRALDEGAAAAGELNPQRRPALRWRAGWLAAGIVAIIGLAALLWRIDGNGTSGPAVAPIRSIAVLPLANLSGDPSQEYLADGMTDELISTLGRVDGLNVISRTSIMRFKDSTLPLPEIAKTLNVGAVLEGSVLVLQGRPGEPAGSRYVRINARLLNAGTDTQLWNRTFERNMTDVLRLQSDIAAAVADGVDLKLTQQQQTMLEQTGGTSARQGTQNPDAVDLYLRGRYHWNMRTREGFMRSIQYFREALDRDAGFARAHAGLADAYNLLGIYGMIPRAEADAQASRAAAAALDLDSSLAEAHTSLGHIRNQRLEWEGAEASLKRAIQLRPAYATAHHWYSIYLSQLGRLDEAVAEIDRAVALDPLSTTVNAQRGVVLLLTRRYDDAIAQLERTLRIDPAFARAHMVLAEAYAHKGVYDRALAETDRATALGGAGVELTADIGYILAVAGRRGEAVKIAEQLAAQYGSGQISAAAGAATVYAGMRDIERTMEWLERAWERQDPAIADLKVDPRFDSVRGDPRFGALLKRAGLGG